MCIFGRLGGSEGYLGGSFGGLRASWTALGRSWVALGPLLASLGWLLARLGPLLARLGPLLAALGPPLGRSWPLLGHSWAALGLLLRVSWPLLVRKHEFAKSIVKPEEKHTFLIPRWLRNAARWPQDGSKSPLGSLLGRSWSDLAPLGATWGR